MAVTLILIQCMKLRYTYFKCLDQLKIYKKVYEVTRKNTILLPLMISFFPKSSCSRSSLPLLSKRFEPLRDRALLQVKSQG
jgi:hypothetical protein